ncbi:aminotransferase class V-fold PLP-dependent enzyme [Kitasatospora sp. NPDC096147]|uniref:aminotransferase class V-fold PLP-dependent enzyme n=1 Tax=Kitasatospora sp. NPDC096147 TaxID=3364093 RepID=UPI003813F2C3
MAGSDGDPRSPGTGGAVLRGRDFAALRAEEFPYLEASGQAYLDYTGAALPPLSLVRGHAERLASAVYGNPHSASPASGLSTRLAEQARRAVLDFCGAPADDYVVVFTPNATGALRLVAEAYPFGPERGLLMLGDDHNSVLGIRRYARPAGAPVTVVAPGPQLRTGTADLLDALAEAERLGGPGLFAFPAQSNATGVRHPLEWVPVAQARGWRVLLDAAAYLPTGPLDLAAVPADFTALSWYKITGYPSGVGCLIARREALGGLRRPWFAGGTVLASSSHTDWHLPAPAPERLEDGTLAFLSLPDVTAAARWHTALGYPALRHHTGRLTTRLLDGLAGLRHPDGSPGVRLVGPADTEARGPTVTFHLLRPDGRPLDERLCQRAASAAGISIRTGCFCNPGVAEQENGLTPEVVRTALAGAGPAGLADVDDYLRLLPLRAQGAVRASVGAATGAADVDRLLTVCQDLLRRQPPDPVDRRSGC